MSKHRPSLMSDKDRAVAFSDSVIAIVITLLVLDLRPPPFKPGGLLAGMLRQWPTYTSYVTSFVYVAVIWLNHKAAFRYIDRMDRGLHWANLGVLFSTALIPFPTSVIANAASKGDAADQRIAVILYALAGMLLCMCWAVFFHYLSRHRDLLEADAWASFFAHERRRPLLGLALYAAAGVLGYLATPWLALAIFFMLPAYYGVTSHGLGAEREGHDGADHD